MIPRELTIIQDKQWQHYLLLSQLSEYHFLFNMLLIVISILQITVANETALKEAEANPEESQSLTVSKRQSLRSLLNSRHTQRGLFSSFKENLKDDRLSHSYQESILNDKEETFVDRVFHWIDDSLPRFFASDVVHTNKITSVLVLLLSTFVLVSDFGYLLLVYSILQVFVMNL